MENSPEPLLTVSQVARRLHVDKQTVYRWIWARRLKAKKYGGALRIRAADLENIKPKTKT